MIMRSSTLCSPRAYISCDSERCDEGLIGLCLAASSCLDDDKWLGRMYTRLVVVNTHTRMHARTHARTHARILARQTKSSHHNTSVTCHNVFIYQINILCQAFFLFLSIRWALLISLSFKSFGVFMLHTCPYENKIMNTWKIPFSYHYVKNENS